MTDTADSVKPATVGTMAGFGEWSVRCLDNDAGIVVVAQADGSRKQYPIPYAFVNRDRKVTMRALELGKFGDQFAECHTVKLTGTY